MLDKYKLTKKEKVMLWLYNYDFGESLNDITDWVKFQSIVEFTDRLVMNRKADGNHYFLYTLKLDNSEEIALREYLLKKKPFVVKHLLKRESFSPYNHLYQLYIQYLPDNLNEIEKNIFLAGYINMLESLHGVDCSVKRVTLEKKLNMR